MHETKHFLQLREKFEIERFKVERGIKIQPVENIQGTDELVGGKKKFQIGGVQERESHCMNIILFKKSLLVSFVKLNK